MSERRNTSQASSTVLLGQTASKTASGRLMDVIHSMLSSLKIMEFVDIGITSFSLCRSQLSSSFRYKAVIFVGFFCLQPKIVS